MDSPKDVTDDKYQDKEQRTISPQMDKHHVNIMKRKETQANIVHSGRNSKLEMTIEKS